jgi:hypothetical protein
MRPDRRCRVYKAFLSSTIKNLADYREAVRRAVARRGFQPVKSGRVGRYDRVCDA